jgi:hypothetical protein
LIRDRSNVVSMTGGIPKLRFWTAGNGFILRTPN